MKWKIFSIICFILIIPLLVKWYADSQDYGKTLMFSHEKKEIVTIAKDDLFGNESKKTTWQSGFWLGLLPPTDQISPGIFLGVVPMGSVLIVLGVISLIIYRRNKNKLTE